jgi:arylformamidase
MVKTTNPVTLYDISRLVSPTLKVWPGDTAFSTRHVLRQSAGASVNLTTFTLSAHTGSHADAPYHYHDGDAHPADLPLDPYIGSAHLVTVTRRTGEIVPTDLAGYDLGGIERLLIHTWVSDLPDNAWPDDFPYPSLALIDWLAHRQVVLVGTDAPSVDRFDSQDLPGHHRLRQHGMVNLETLCFAGVPDGRYELVALPLKLAEGCASPVRAVLRII